MYIELDIEELEREHLEDIRLEEDEETFSIRGIGTFLLIPYNDSIWRLYFKDPSIPIHEKINTYIRVHREENSLVGVDPINEHRITHPNNPRLAAALLVPRAY